MSTEKSNLLLCDQMCQELGRWLRIAGYDTAIIQTPLKDEEVFQKALKENRLLITKDRHFKKIDPDGKTIIYLKGDTLEEWAKQLKEEEKIDWLFKPFSRCLQCNCFLVKIPPPDVVPKLLREEKKEFWTCPECKQIFWEGSHTERMLATLQSWQNSLHVLTLGFGGDLMIGRLVNKQLEHRSPTYIWGDLRPVLSKIDINIVNLETTLTHSVNKRSKVFNFKANPKNVFVLKEGYIHAVNLANNHILDFSEEGLIDTIQTLDKENIQHVGAGSTLSQAKKPVIIEKKGIKVGILGATDNEPGWKAGKDFPGTNYLEIGDITPLKESILSLRKEVDLLILSLHWGPNMVRRPPHYFRSFAYELIDLGVDILHGHSAHVFQGVEIYKKKLILYDTGDLVDDYMVDPILRNDLSFYFIVKADKKQLLSLKMIPTAISECQVNIHLGKDSLDEMHKLCKELGTELVQEEHGFTLIVNPSPELFP